MNAAQNQRSLVRLAVAIHAELVGCKHVMPLAELPEAAWNRAVWLSRRIGRAESRRWQLAARQLRREYECTLNSVQAVVSDISTQLASHDLLVPISTPRDLYHDLLALETEFEQVAYDLRNRTLSVSTEPLELEGVYLGPFEIRLDWSRLSFEPSYHVIALDARPAEAREAVTHPHVLEEVLCEGHGRTAIQRALAAGRLADFFTLVASVLRTYNPESAFVQLCEWNSNGCTDCGALVARDEGCCCPQCEAIVCSECSTCCCGCGDGHCTNCLTPCAICDDTFCRWCLNNCPGCRRSVCQDCFNEQERCPNCYEEELEDSTTGQQQSAAAVHTDCLGQVARPAGCG